MRSRLDKDIRDVIVGHGNKKKDSAKVYLSFSDKDLVQEIDKLTFDHGKTEISGTKITHMFGQDSGRSNL
jgi:hypothetical protein